MLYYDSFTLSIHLITNLHRPKLAQHPLARLYSYHGLGSMGLLVSMGGSGGEGIGDVFWLWVCGSAERRWKRVFRCARPKWRRGARRVADGRYETSKRPASFWPVRVAMGLGGAVEIGKLGLIAGEVGVLCCSARSLAIVGWCA
jgi:hypothetical protein